MIKKSLNSKTLYNIWDKKDAGGQDVVSRDQLIILLTISPKKSILIIQPKLIVSPANTGMIISRYNAARNRLLSEDLKNITRKTTEKTR